MTDKTLQLLLASDHPSATEAPPGFDYVGAMRRVKALVPTLERIVGRELAVDESAQDASFFTDVACYQDGFVKGIGAVKVPVISIVFSSFGGLFTVFFADALDRATVDQAISLVVDAGFTFVPSDELDQPYTGSNPYLSGMSDMTWLTRFFCYL